jgi:ribonuclease HI
VNGNEQADKLADEGRRKPEGSDLIDMHIPTPYVLAGAKLSSMTQSKAYKIIKHRKILTSKYQEALDRYTTNRNITYAQDAALDSKGDSPSAKQIRKSVKHKDLSRSIWYFLWMLIHDAYKVGKHWLKVSGSEWKGICTSGVTETMNHILTECQENGQKQVWDLALELWILKTKQLLRPLIGEIMVRALIKRGTKPGATDKATSRLYRILVSESAHLIWRLRNERRLQGKEPASEREITLRWRKTMNLRLELDCQMTNARWAWKAISKSLVLKTWQGVQVQPNSKTISNLSLCP